MKKEELFHDDFLKQFKNGEELNTFLHQLQKRACRENARRRTGCPFGVLKTVHVDKKLLLFMGGTQPAGNVLDFSVIHSLQHYGNVIQCRLVND